MKSVEKKKAIELRKKGYSIGVIAKKLNVSKASISSWVRDVKLSLEQLGKLKSNSHSSEAIENRRAARLKNEKKKRDSVQSESSRQVSEISDYELTLIATALYWAEGGKRSRTMVRFSNSDPRMIEIMMKYYRKVCRIPEEKFRGYVHLHDKTKPEDAVRYWSDISGINKKQFFKTHIKKTDSTKDTLPNGTFEIYICDTNLYLKTMGLIDGMCNQLL